MVATRRKNYDDAPVASPRKSNNNTNITRKDKEQQQEEDDNSSSSSKPVSSNPPADYLGIPSFAVNVEDLTTLHQSRDVGKLQQAGGITGVAKALSTDLKAGVKLQEARTFFADRRARYGSNVIPSPPLEGILSLIWQGLQDKTLIMLIVSAIVSLVLGVWENPSTGWIEGTAILTAVALVLTVSSTNDYHKEKQFRALNDKKNNKLVKVTRGGVPLQVSVYDINAGDIVTIDVGDILCADGLVISSEGLELDESTLTGESESIKKNSLSSPFLFSGSQVVSGTGVMLVVCVGPNSESGRMLAMLQSPPQDTPLQEKLEALAEKIAHFGIVAAAGILVLLIIKFIVITVFFTPNGKLWDFSVVSTFIKYFITSVTIVVVAVPEGLPLAVTISLAYSMVKMLKDNNLVRHLEACETMGGATNICSDKTGTLTKNQMTVLKGWVAGKFFEEASAVKKSTDANTMELLSNAIALNSTAYEARDEAGKVKFIGSQTECAMLNFLRDLGLDFEDIRSLSRKIKSYPFSSEKKRMSTIANRPGGKDSEYLMYTKGASEIVLGLCDRYLKAGEGEVVLDSTTKNELTDAIQRFAAFGLRTICIAYNTLDAKKVVISDDVPAPESDLVCLAILGIKDPVRDEVPHAVHQCQQAGITVRMVTGDNIITAKQIAKECGIFNEEKGGIAMEGPEFRALSTAEMDRIVPNLQVLARSSPTDKYILVSKLKQLGEVVAATGDGSNDSIALKEAHVGFSMGITGTEVCKEASDIVLMDDNFSSIVKAVMWGRNVYDSIRKFLQFQLTVNLVAVSVAFVGALANEHGESPLKPVQLLWVNLIMDTMAALALATEAPTPELLNREPYGKNDNLITKQMWRNIIGQAAYQFIVSMAMLYYGPNFFGVEKDSVHHLSLIFNTFVMCQLFNEINSRKLGKELNAFSGIFTNKVFVGVMVFTLVVQYLMVQYGGDFTGTTALSVNEWLYCLAIGAGGLPIGLLLRSVLAAPVQKVQRRAPMVSSPAALRRWGKVKTATKTLGIVNTMKPKTTIGTTIRRHHRVSVLGNWTAPKNTPKKTAKK